MRIFSCLLILAMILQPGYVLSRQPATLLHTRNGAVSVAPLSQKQVNEFHLKSLRVAGQYFGILQLSAIPTASQRAKLETHGIRLLEFAPPASYLVSISKNITLPDLTSCGVKALLPIPAALKIEKGLAAAQQQTESRVLVAFYETIPFDTVAAQLSRHQFLITDAEFRNFHLLTVQVPAGRLSALADLPVVAAVGPAMYTATPLNRESRNDSRANAVQSALPGGYNLTGKGVVVGISEAASGYPDPHADFIDRLNGTSNRPGDYHATHVFGTVAGAGNINEKYKGYAPGASIIGSGNSFNGLQLPNLVNTLGMVVTNNSYATGSQCMVSNDLNNYLYEKVALDFPRLLNVYAVGNWGDESCTDYPLGFNTVASGGNGAKNTLTVGNLLHTGEVAPSSSRGPGYGGRIKPDIMAPGSQIYSTISPDRYGLSSGTSMAAPAVTGGVALLQERYRQLHNNEIPSADLVKAILCNTANDLGNKGPDFVYGFGAMNLLKAMRVMDKGYHATGNITNGQTKTHTIQIPANAAQLKVMLYWHDPANGLISTRVLVHDLDLELQTPGAATILPFVLDTIHANVANPAIRGRDHINNVEQVVLDRPAAGTYSIIVKGTEIGQESSQQYVIVYDVIEDQVALTFPFTGEAIPPGEATQVQWDDWQGNTADYKIEYSSDLGNTWEVLAAAVPATLRQYAWTAPANASAQSLVRISRNDNSSVSVSGAFVISGVPQIKLSAAQCRGYIQVEWTALAEATDYEIFLLRQGQMTAIGSTTATNYIIKSLSTDSTYWVGVRARINGKAGRRSVAVSRKPDTGNCTGGISDGDLQLLSIQEPANTRALTSFQWNGNEKLKISIRNLDDRPAQQVSVKYRINNSDWITETISQNIAAAANYLYTFSTGLQLINGQQYLVEAVVQGTADTNPSNDTARLLLRELPNLSIDLSQPFKDSFYLLPGVGYQSSFRGLPGAERVDYFNGEGRGRFFTGNVYNTSVRAGLGMNLVNVAASHEMSLTYNLSAYTVTDHEVTMQLVYSLIRTVATQSTTMLSIRGNDQLPWIPAYDFGAQSDYFNFNTPVLNISKLLRDAGQQFSSSFQLRVSQQGTNANFTISEVKLANTTHDVELIRIDSFKLLNTELSVPMPLHAKLVSHAKQTQLNVPVKYRINNGDIVTETIPSLSPGDTITYTFARKADLSHYQRHQVEAWVDNPGDAVASNNLKTAATMHQRQVVTDFPYLQDFETTNDNWISDGIANSWQYGEPGGVLIRDAASGTKAWKTSLNGLYNPNEFSAIYSPAFNLSTLQSPVLSFSVALDYDFCFSNFCDIVSFAYSTDGLLWRALPPGATSYNWQAGWNGLLGPRWRVKTVGLPKLPKVFFRLMLRSNNYTEKEGVAFDDFHIYDSTGSIHPATLTPVSMENDLAGNDWVHFKQDGKIMLSVHPREQDLGIVKATVYSREGKSGNFHGQYYLNRNIVLEGKQPASPVMVRIYFRDAEMDSLLALKTCVRCTKARDPYRLGVSAYHSTDLQECNDQITDNLKGQWEFIGRPGTRIVPFTDGYYAEFETRYLGEYWLHNGGLDNKTRLPVTILDFKALKANGNEALLTWATASEINIERFEIEVAKSNEEYSQGQFSKLGEQTAAGASGGVQQYQFREQTAGKSGTWYYRLKALDENGNYSYSDVSPVNWSDELSWYVFPNPSVTGSFTLVHQSAPGESVQLQVYNASGTIIHQRQVQGNGFVQQTTIDLGAAAPAGIYLLRAQGPSGRWSIKLLRQ